MKHILLFMIVGVICGCVMGIMFHRMSMPEARVRVARHVEPPVAADVKVLTVVTGPVIVTPQDSASPSAATEVQGPVAPRALKSKKAGIAVVSGAGVKPKRAVVTGVPQAAGDPVIAEPVARDALNYVGMDAQAEAVWMTAINDPSLSSHDRKNLIEDLNENGISDPDHPTADDLPLIESRISLIEQLAPDSMDEVNYAAFQEAYKDLWNMHDRLVAK